MNSGLASWRRIVANDVREKRIALARVRRELARLEQIESLLLAERERRDASARTDLRRGELPTFADERMNVLLERAIERAREKVAQAKTADRDGTAKLADAWRRAAALDRLLARRREQERSEERRVEQKELDEIAGRRRFAAGTAASSPAEELR